MNEVETETYHPAARSTAADWFARGIGFAGGGLLVYGLVNGLVVASSVVLLFFLALLLASALTPLVDRLRSALPIARGGALLLVYLAFFGVVIGSALLVVPGAINQVGELVAALPPALQRLRDASQTLEPAVLRSSLASIIDAAQAALKPGPSTPPAPGQVVATGLTVLGVVVDVTTTLALVYFWLTERARLQRYVLSFVPAERRAGVREGWNEVEVRLGSWVRGQLTLMASLAVMTGVAYSVLGLPSALLLALIAGLAEVVPIVGPALRRRSRAARGDHPETRGPAALVLGAYVVIQFIEGNVLVPIIMRNALGVSPLLIALSLLVGTAIAGFIGALIAVPVAAAIEAVLERMQDREVPVAQDATAARTTADEVVAGDPDVVRAAQRSGAG